MSKTTFEERCLNDPQGLIRDLIKQTTKQAKEIHDLNEKLALFEKETKIQAKRNERH